MFKIGIIGHGYGAAIPAPITSNLIYYIDPKLASSYPGSGTIVNDLSVSNSNTLLINGTAYDAVNKVFTSDGLNDRICHEYVSGDRYNLAVTGQITLDFWVNYSTLVRGLDGGMSFGDYFGNRTSNHFQWQFIKHVTGSDAYWVFQIGNQTQYWDLTLINNTPLFTPPAAMAASTWYNFSFTANAATGIICYINGVNAGGSLSGAAVTYFNIPYYTRLNVSGRSDSLYPMLGKMGHTKIYDRQLTSVEVLQNFNAHKADYGL